MSAELVCAVDVGTSAVRAAFVAADGTIAAQQRVARGAGEQAVRFDAERLWADVCTALARLTSTHGADVRALAVAAHVGTVLTDAGGEVLIAAGWGDSTGVTELAARWAGGDELRVAGRPTVTGSAAALLAALRRKGGPAWSRVGHVLAPKDFLLWRLCGVHVTDRTSAAYSLLSDVRVGAWSSTLTRGLVIDSSCLPAQHDAAAVVGEISPAVASATGLPAGLRVVAGGPDGTVGALAMIGARQDAVADVSGTTDVVLAVVDAPPHAVEQVVLNPYLLSGCWSCGGPTGFTGGAVSYWSRLVGLGEPAAMEPQTRAALMQIAPGAEGLVLIPYLNGSRFPYWNAAERGSLSGLSDAHTPLHVVRAAQEGAAYALRAAVDALGDAGIDQSAEVIIGGGTSGSADQMQLRANVLGRSVCACSDPDVTLRGAAILACVGAGLHPGLAEAHAVMGPSLNTADPQPAVIARYEELFERWQQRRQAADTAG